MSGADHRLEVEIVLWHPQRDVAAVVDELRSLTLRTDDERALATAATEVHARTGLATAVLDLTDTHLHLEVLDADAALDWQEPTTPMVGRAPWNHRGWFEQTRARIDEAMRREVGASQVGPIRQVKHWSISALIEVASDAGTFWFKQVPPFMNHEARLTAWLSAWRPGAVPRVVAAGDDWYLAAAFAPPSDERSLESPHGLLAELQLSAAARIDELLALGCPDRAPATMTDELLALAERADALDPALGERLAAALPLVGDLVAELDDSPVPITLVHGDLHGGNWTRGTDGSWLIFDWTDGCVSHPFFDLGVLPTQDTELRDARLSAYLAPWRAAFGEGPIEATLAAALPLADGFHALSYQRIVDGVGGGDSESWKPVVGRYVTRLLDAVAPRPRPTPGAPRRPAG